MAEIERPKGISRRELVKRGAIGGTVLWAAPLISSIGPAHAHNVPGSPVHGCCECTTCTGPAANAAGRVCIQNGCLSPADCAAACAAFPNNCTGSSTTHCGPVNIPCSNGICQPH